MDAALCRRRGRRAPDGESAPQHAWRAARQGQQRAVPQASIGGTFKWALKAAVAQAEERASGMAEKASLDSESEGPIKYNDKEKHR